MTVFNSDDYSTRYYEETLAELRTSILERLGYAAQTANPPPGMKSLIDNFLRRSQNFLYRRYSILRTDRYFTWTMVPGERFYGIRVNDDSGLRLDPRKLIGAWLEDTNGAVYPMKQGIPATLYTSSQNEGLPCRFEVRNAIEVFPAPSEAYRLVIRGHFGPTRFTEDDDVCSVDSELLFMWALANAKNHYGQPDGKDIAAQAQTYLRELVAESHGARRYIPGCAEAVEMPRPLFTFED